MRGSPTFYVYLLCSENKRAFYVGRTEDLQRRMIEHKAGVYDDAHTKKYNICQLMYYEEYTDFEEARRREARLKKWNRAWKLNLVDKTNPGWEDLAKDW